MPISVGLRGYEGMNVKVTQDIVTNHVTFQPTPTRQAMSRAQPFPYKFDTSVKLRFFRSLEEKISNGFHYYSSKM